MQCMLSTAGNLNGVVPLIFQRIKQLKKPFSFSFIYKGWRTSIPTFWDNNMILNVLQGGMLLYILAHECNPKVHWNRQGDIPVLHPVLHWGCCQATVGQGKTFSFSPLPPPEVVHNWVNMSSGAEPSIRVQPKVALHCSGAGVVMTTCSQVPDLSPIPHPPQGPPPLPFSHSRTLPSCLFSALSLPSSDLYIGLVQPAWSSPSNTPRRLYAASVDLYTSYSGPAYLSQSSINSGLHYEWLPWQAHLTLCF